MYYEYIIHLFSVVLEYNTMSLCSMNQGCLKVCIHSAGQENHDLLRILAVHYHIYMDLILSQLSPGETQTPSLLRLIVILSWYLALRRILGPRRDEVTSGWRKLYTEELHNLHSSPSIIRIAKSRRVRWAGHVVQMGRREMHVGCWRKDSTRKTKM
jgi:hypothetical protein